MRSATRTAGALRPCSAASRISAASPHGTTSSLGIIYLPSCSLQPSHTGYDYLSTLESNRSIAIINRRGRVPSSDLPRDSTVADEVGDVCSLLSHVQPP